MMKKPDGIVFFDLDGTLLSAKGTILPSSIDAINSLVKRNILPVVATGRTVCELGAILSQTGISSVVAMNGQFVMHNFDPIYANRMDPNKIERLYQLAKEQGYALSFYNDSQIRTSEHQPYTEKLYCSLHHKTVPEIDPEFYLHHPVYMVLLQSECGEEQFIPHFPEFTFSRNTPYCVDIYNKGGSKAEGIRQFFSALDFEAIPTYAFGDGINDIEMFKLVDHPIAMGNAVPSLKKEAIWVTTDNNNDGIYKGLQQVGLL